MDKIEFLGVMPNAFSGELRPAHSDVWGQNRVELCRGERYLIECASGTGKSSFCSYLLGMRNDFSGSICFDGVDISRLSRKDWTQLRRREISLMFQELRLFPELTAYENVALRCALGQSKREGEIMEWFERLGLREKINTPLGLLSFGQRQRVALMRALAGSFSFLLLDEPTSHLDDANSKAAAALVMEEAARKNAAVVVTSIGRHMDIDYTQTFSL